MSIWKLEGVLIGKGDGVVKSTGDTYKQVNISQGMDSYIYRVDSDYIDIDTLELYKPYEFWFQRTKTEFNGQVFDRSRLVKAVSIAMVTNYESSLAALKAEFEAKQAILKANSLATYAKAANTGVTYNSFLEQQNKTDEINKDKKDK